MMQLKKLLNGLDTFESHGGSDLNIKGLACDSRQVRPGFLFVAYKGPTADGHEFIKDALQNGAVAVVGESFQSESRRNGNIAKIIVPNSRKALSTLAANFFGHPYESMELIGITGTNGKTSTSYLLESIISAAGARPGVIGTINYRSPENTWNAPVTTPGALELMSALRSMADSDVSHVIMEVSSHALDQGRVEGCPFRIAIFTNISRDHLDYHGSMAEYFKAKSLLFRELKNRAAGDKTRAVINIDDPRGKALVELTDAPVITYALERECDVWAKELRFSRKGLTARLVTPVGPLDIRSSLIGDFNIYNILAASAAALCMDMDPNTIELGIKRLKGIPGRLEMVRNRRALTIVVDYAHTPDALIKTLIAVKSLSEEGRLITVFGCGGDRDTGKRREMGKAAGRFSDLVVITSDNPRSEDPEKIISQIEEGVCEAGLKKLDGLFGDCRAGPGYISEVDRSKAIQRAIEIAHKRDFVLIAGKGHEDYQIIGKNKRHFDDREIAAEAAS